MSTHAVTPPPDDRAAMDVVLCWHMHQPDYRYHDVYQKPWTWLHAIKDYTDMAAHLESVPGARAVVNFSGVLIEQLGDYPCRIAAFLDRGEPIGDSILDALGGAAPNQGDRHELIGALMRVNEARMKRRFAPYARLFERAESERAGGTPLSDQEFCDLLVWYVLVWLGESLRKLPLIEALAARGRDFTIDHRRALLWFLAETIDGVLPRFAELAKAGVAELSLTPYAHPILPLLLDTQAAREAMPESALPEIRYPGGRQRCLWHLEEGRRVFAGAFGHEARGCWPSEGAVSNETLELLAAQRFLWTASGNKVLLNSLANSTSGYDPVPHLDSWRCNDSDTTCFFRDDGLSDLIGFEYSKWRPQDAVQHLIGQMLHRRDEHARGPTDTTPVLSIIMDGENAWEYFPENGWPFLQALYRSLAAHPELNLTTFSEVAARSQPRSLQRLRAGSWVHGTMSTWIGDPAKNRAWELLAAAKSSVDAALAPFNENKLPDWAGPILRQLAICEASDWFWWLGEGNRLQDGPEFDALFRQQLESLYKMIGILPPGVLDHPLDREHEVSPVVDSEPPGAMRRSSPA